MSNKNKSKLIKRLITGAMCLTLVFSINGFASVVSDNDGSAFITKAEFDSLKNNFQSQIDQYNQSIDSKIDGAIAAYLAGLSVSVMENRTILSNFKDGVTLVNDDKTLRWTEGIMDAIVWVNNYRAGVNGQLINSARAIGSVLIDLHSKNPSSFKENIIIKSQYTDDYGLYDGYYETKQVFNRTLMVASSGNYWGSSINSTTTPYVRGILWCGKLDEVNDIRYFSNTDKVMVDGWDQASATSFWRLGVGSEATQTSETNSIGITNLDGGGPAFTLNREKIKTLQSNHVTITSSNVTALRLNNDDVLHNWYNDDNSAKDTSNVPFHTEVVDYSDFFEASDTCGFYTTLFKNYGTTAAPNYGMNVNGEKATLQSGWYNLSGITIGRCYRPYFGFDKRISKWNDLSITAYDDGYEKISNAITGGVRNYNTFTEDGESVKRLRLDAGIPLCEVKQDEQVNIPLTFKDTTKNYDVWIKQCDFTYNTNPWAEPTSEQGKMIKKANVSFSSSAISDRSTGITGDNCGFVVSGTGETIKFNVTNDGFLFLKFAEHGKEGKGEGCIYLPTFCSVLLPS